VHFPCRRGLKPSSRLRPHAHNVHYVNSPGFLNPLIVVNPMAWALPVTAA
jgi:hypothetical protein